jgi:zinc-ribbon domain
VGGWQLASANERGTTLVAGREGNARKVARWGQKPARKLVASVRGCQAVAPVLPLDKSLERLDREPLCFWGAARTVRAHEKAGTARTAPAGACSRRSTVGGPSVFCPNCGTQNPDAAQTCSKCNFHLKSAAAPKFKGTMLMMNQPGVLPGSPPAQGRPAPGGPPGAGAVPSKLKGTMVGVAPMAGGGAPLPPLPTAPPTPTPPPPGGQPHGGHSPEAASAFSPPVPQGGVNPLGGTVAADAGMFGAFAVQQHGVSPGGPGGTSAMGQQPYGAPPGSPGGSAPPLGPAGLGGGYAPPYGAPPHASPLPPPQAGFPPFGVPPPPPPPGGPSGLGPGFGGPPPYGAPLPSAYGGGDAYGQPQAPAGYGQPYPGQPGPGQAVVPYVSGPMVGTLKSQGAGTTGPSRRNALLTLLLPAAVIFGGVILSVILAFTISPALAPFAALFMLGGGIWYLLLGVQMVNELKAVTRSEELAWWPLIVPVYNIYFMWFVVPQEVGKAKQLIGVRQPPQPILLYIFLWHFAFASDLNDMVR